MNGSLAQSPEVLLATLAQHAKLLPRGLCRLNEGIDVAQRAPEADFETGVLAGVMRLCMSPDATLGLFPHRWWD